MQESIPLVVRDRAWLCVDSLEPDVVDLLKAEFTYRNPERDAARAQGRRFEYLPETVTTWRNDLGIFSFSRGGLDRARKILAENHVGHHLVDETTGGTRVTRFPKYVGFPLRQHQIEMVETGLAHPSCIIRAGTGSGKTLATFALLAHIGLNALVILPTMGLFEQWMEWAERALGVSGDDLGIIQGKVERLRPLTLAMQMTLGRYGLSKKAKKFFGVIGVDEAQRSASDSLVRVIDSSPAKYRIAVTASEKRKDRKDFLIRDLFGAVAYEAKRDDLTDKGIIVDVEVRIILTKFRAPWYGATVKEKDYNRLLNEMVEDKLRLSLGLARAHRAVVGGEQVLMFTHRREQARLIDRFFVSRGISSGLLIGDGAPGDAAEFLRAKAGLEEGDVRVGVGTYGALGYGIDIPGVSVGVAVTPMGTNEQMFNQARGRLCRTHGDKVKGVLYYLHDLHVFGTKPIKNIAAWNKNAFVLNRTTAGDEWIPAKAWLRERTRRIRAGLPVDV